jgi:hypothetical protein
VSWPVQDLADAFLAQLRTDASLPVFDGKVTGTPAKYALVYFYIETPDGLAAPDAVPLTFDSDVIDAFAYVHCVGGDATGARAVSGRVRNAVLNRRLTVSGRDCNPIRWSQGSPPRRDEETGPLVMDQVDVYTFRSIPA